MKGNTLQRIMIGFGFIWLVLATVIMFMSESPMSTNDLIRYYGTTVCANVWFVGSIVVGAVRKYSI